MLFIIIIFFFSTVIFFAQKASLNSMTRAQWRRLGMQTKNGRGFLSRFRRAVDLTVRSPRRLPARPVVLVIHGAVFVIPEPCAGDVEERVHRVGVMCA